MEENVNNNDKDAEKENSQSTRDEILAMSREENKNGDERQIHIYKTAIQIAYSIGLILCGIIMIVSSIFDRFPTELIIVYMGMLGVTGMFCGIKFTKRRPLFLVCGVLGIIACVSFFVYWILQLCGVV